MNRYEKKPLLRLLECYVLKSIDQLSKFDTDNLASMEPKLSEVYGKSGTWNEIIEAEMGFPAEMPAMIAGVWEKNRILAREKNVDLDPQKFAEMFVDNNFA